MPETITLSEAAVAVLRFEIKGWRAKDGTRRLPAYRELSAAGIMETVPGSPSEFRFTEHALGRREQILEAAESNLRDLEPRLPERIDLSDAARDLVRRILAEEHVAVTRDNLGTYRELARAGIMYPVSGMASGPEANFRFTDQGWDRRHEWIAPPTVSP